MGDGVGDVAVGSASIAVIHGADKYLLTPSALVLAASAAVSVSVPISGRRAEAVAVVSALSACTILEKALSGFWLLPLMVGRGRQGRCAVRRGTIHGGAILRGRAVLLPLALGALVA